MHELAGLFTEQFSPDQYRLSGLSLDSGAFSLYWKYGVGRRVCFYESDEYWDYVDQYAEYVKAVEDGLDFYANVDAIFNPELTWKTQKYLENTHKLSPLPTVHLGTPVEWLQKYLKEGYDFIGFGGMAKMKRGQHHPWLDQMFTVVCPGPKHLPVVKIHGFAMTSLAQMIRYPWWSVDSASWQLSGSYGAIFVPRKRGHSYQFLQPPLVVSCSAKTPFMKPSRDYRHLQWMQPSEKREVLEWLEVINVPLGKADADGELVEPGVVSHRDLRIEANLKYFWLVQQHLPEWPRPFTFNSYSGFRF